MTSPLPGSSAAGAPEGACSYWTPVDVDDDRMRAGLRLMAARRRGDLDAGARHVGWKVGWNDAGIRQLLGLRSGSVGYLTDLTLAPDGIIPVTGGTYAAEVEVAFTLHAAVGSTDSDERALAAIDHVQPAVEIVDFGELDVVDALERDIWHHGFALGPPTPWARAVIDDLTVRFRHNGVDIDVPPPGGDKLAHVASMLRFVAGGAEVLGQELRAGDLVLTGSLARRVRWLSAGDRLDVDMQPIGGLSVSLQEGEI
jgi:2-keto-4-pentenoate hydratase